MRYTLFVCLSLASTFILGYITGSRMTTHYWSAYCHKLEKTADASVRVAYDCVETVDRYLGVKQ
jgi:hypothetical protein